MEPDSRSRGAPVARKAHRWICESCPQNSLNRDGAASGVKSGLTADKQACCISYAWADIGPPMR
jgi:hypothetical protein